MRSFDALMDMCASTRWIQMYHVELGGEEYIGKPNCFDKSSRNMR